MQINRQTGCVRSLRLRSISENLIFLFNPAIYGWGLVVSEDIHTPFTAFSLDE